MRRIGEKHCVSSGWVASPDPNSWANIWVTRQVPLQWFATWDEGRNRKLSPRMLVKHGAFGFWSCAFGLAKAEFDQRVPIFSPAKTHPTLWPNR